VTPIAGGRLAVVPFVNIVEAAALNDCRRAF
jgi:hypothetical protein